MSLKAHLWALDNAPVNNPTAVLVLVALADEALDDGTGAAPYMQKVVARARCSERSAQDHLRALFRARIITAGDPSVARRRYKKADRGRLPRVWDLNLAATWESIPTQLTDEEMLAYSTQIGKPPVRRGVQILHPSENDGQEGVQILHPSDDDADDQAISDSGEEDVRCEGCGGSHPWGGGGGAPPGGAPPPAPYPLDPACPRSSPPVGGLVTDVDDQPQTWGDSTSEEDLDRIVDWFIRRRPDWAPRIRIAEALTTSVEMGLGSLAESSDALRELAEGLHGATGSPRRLHAYPDGGWWNAAKERRAMAAAARRAAAPRCSVKDHQYEPADGCTICKVTAIGRPDEESAEVSDAAASGEMRYFRQRRGQLGEEAEVAS